MLVRKKSKEKFERWIEGKTIELRGMFLGMRKKALFGCLVCGWEWEVDPFDVMRSVGSGCRKCAASARKRPNEILGEWDAYLRLDVSSPKYPESQMLINRKKWEILVREGIGRVSIGTKGYPVAVWNGKNVFVHRILMGFPESPQQVDHINGIKWDNRMCNLRVVTALENQMNRGLRKTNKSGVVGVYEKKPGIWEACLKVGRKTVHRSLHKTKEGAAAARGKAVAEHCGEYAPKI